MLVWYLVMECPSLCVIDINVACLVRNKCVDVSKVSHSVCVMLVHEHIVKGTIFILCGVITITELLIVHLRN